MRLVPSHSASRGGRGDKSGKILHWRRGLIVCTFVTMVTYRKVEKHKKDRKITHYLKEDQDQVERYSMYTIGTPRQDPYIVTLQLNG